MDRTTNLKKFINLLSPIIKTIVPILFFGTIVSSSLSSCFTGIESTKKIEVSKEEQTIKLSSEDTILNHISGVPIQNWKIGKEFFITDQRICDLFGSFSNPNLLPGKKLYFSDISIKKAPNGENILHIIFSDDNNNQYSFNSRKSIDNTILSDQIPMLIDLDMIKQTELLLKGKHLWTLSNLWYDTSGNAINGKKFVPVTITQVLPGNKVFPCMIVFDDQNGNTASQLINLGKSGIESRKFADLFSLSDPRLKYPNIYDDIWTLIQNAKVKTGMSKEECRLSLGSPEYTNSGHDYSKTIDIWQYSHGAYLRFEDGILVEFRL